MAKHRSIDHANYQHHHRRECRQAASPFFNLPPEVRDLIYYYALVCSVPLELCPAKYFIDDVDANEMSELKLSEVLGVQKLIEKKSTHQFVLRDQYGLRKLRQELAVGLLSSCRKAKREANTFFWSENTFRFEDDKSWTLLRRFLITAGSSRKFLRKLQVFPALGLYEESLDRSPYIPWDSSTEGKGPVIIVGRPASRLEILHLHSGLNPKGILKQNMFSVCEMLKLDQTMHEISFVVSAGLSVSWDDYDAFDSPMLIPSNLPFATLSIQVESSACLINDMFLYKYQDCGWNIVFCSGSHISSKAKARDANGLLTQQIRYYQTLGATSKFQTLLETKSTEANKRGHSEVEHDIDSTLCNYCLALDIIDLTQCPWEILSNGSDGASYLSTFPWDVWCAQRIGKTNRYLKPTWMEVCHNCYSHNVKYVRRVGLHNFSSKEKTQFDANLCRLDKDCLCTSKYVHYLYLCQRSRESPRSPPKAIALALRSLVACIGSNQM